MQFLPAVLALNVVVIVALVLLTLAFGRVYCSVICPLGVMQDLISWIHGKKKKDRFTYSAPKNVLRYSVFTVFVVGIALGFGAIITLLSPYGTYGAIVSNLLQPLYLWGNNALAALAEHYDSYAFYSKEVWIKSVPVFATAIALFAAISVLAWRGGRTYCNTICPVGTLLGFVARFSWLKVHFYADKCKNDVFDYYGILAGAHFLPLTKGKHTCLLGLQYIRLFQKKLLTIGQKTLLNYQLSHRF